MRQAGLVWIAVTGIACADPPAAPLAAGASGGSVSAPDGGIERSGDASTGELQPIERGEAPHAAESAHPQVLRLVTWNIQAGRASSLEAVAQRLAKDPGTWGLVRLGERAANEGRSEDARAMFRTAAVLEAAMASAASNEGSAS